MKKYLLPNDVNWYRANFHCHTTHSDGAYTPEKVKDVYKNHGYSIVAFTDHEILLDHSDLNDESFLALTGSEYSVTEADPSFPQIFDVDTGRWPRAKCVHLNIFSKDPHNTFQPASAFENLGWKKDTYKDVSSDQTPLESTPLPNLRGDNLSSAPQLYVKSILDNHRQITRTRRSIASAEQ